MTTEYTPNLNLELPDFNQSPWHDEIKRNFRAIDAALFSTIGITNIKGPYQNSTAVLAGERYYDPEDGQLYEVAAPYTTEPLPTTFAADRAANDANWKAIDVQTVVDAANDAITAAAEADADRIAAAASAATATTQKDLAVIAKDQSVAAKDISVNESAAALASASAASAAAIAAAASAAGIPVSIGTWVTALALVPGNIVRSPIGAAAPGTYIVPAGQAHTSGVFATDVAAGKLVLFAADGPAGPGSGDMLKTENLSGLTNVVTALANLGLTNFIFQPGQEGVFYGTVAPTGWLIQDGAAVLTAGRPRLTAALYIGDANNANVAYEYGYKCTNPANPNGTRSTAGTYIVLPDHRGVVGRGLDQGRGLDAGRVIGSYQASDMASHTHTLTMDAVAGHSHGVTDPSHAHSVYDPGHTHTYNTGGIGGSGAPSLASNGIQSATTGARVTGIGIYGAFTGISIQAGGGHTPTGTVGTYSGAIETRMKNIAKLFCIKDD